MSYRILLEKEVEGRDEEGPHEHGKAQVYQDVAFPGIVFLGQERTDGDGEQDGCQHDDPQQAVFPADVNDGLVLPGELLAVGFPALALLQGLAGLLPGEVGDHHGAEPEIHADHPFAEVIEEQQPGDAADSGENDRFEVVESIPDGDERGKKELDPADDDYLDQFKNFYACLKDHGPLINSI